MMCTGKERGQVLGGEGWEGERIQQVLSGGAGEGGGSPYHLEALREVKFGSTTKETRYKVRLMTETFINRVNFKAISIYDT